jgi:hypothetical protein
MKFSKKRQQYESANCSFNPETMIAKSYDWWIFVKMINGKVVFNNYSYSNTTCKHQSKVRSLLSELGIKIDIFVKTSISLDGYKRYDNSTDTSGALQDAIKTNLREINELEEILSNNRRKKALDEERNVRIMELKKLNKEIVSLIKSTPLEQALYEVC